MDRLGGSPDFCGDHSMTAPARFILRLGVVAVAVAVIVGLGFLWRVSPAADLVADGGPPNRAASASSNRATSLNPLSGDEGRGDRGAHGVSLSHIDDLVQTTLIQLAVLSGVVVVDRQRRSRRRRGVPLGA